MYSNDLIISKGTLQRNQLDGNIALITGAGGGIGYEAARSLIWLGARVVIAEINKEKGKNAEEKLNQEFGEGSAVFIKSDIGNERSVKRLAKKVYAHFGKVDIIINNATITPMGAVHEVGAAKWDLSYSTNLRGPVLLISSFLPDMLKRNSGIVVFVPSSGAAPYMGAYEVFKTAQVELSNTLAAELEETGVITYSIGPGIVKTETAQKAIEEIAPRYGKSVEEFYRMSENALLTTEEAGAGFAASVALAVKYKGLEIGSIQALIDIGISIQKQSEAKLIKLSEEVKNRVLELFKDIRGTFTEQIGGWKDRPVFERQWLIRDFKKLMGAAPEYFLENLKAFEAVVSGNKLLEDDLKKLSIEKIYSYYEHQIDLAKGYEKNPDRLKEYIEIMQGWLGTIDEFNSCMAELKP